jgi:hypothetical protein
MRATARRRPDTVETPVKLWQIALIVLIVVGIAFLARLVVSFRKGHDGN